MRSEQERSAEQISARYQSQRVQSPPALDERILELARERAPQKPQRSWQRAPAWSGVAVVCVLLLLVPGLLESPAPVTGIVDFDDNSPAAESPGGEFSAPAPAAMLKPDAAALSKRAVAEAQLVRQREPQQADAAAPMMSAAAPAMTDSLADQAAGNGVGHPDSAAWLQRIDELLATGDLTAAQAAFAEFRQLYPDAEVSPALLERLAIKP